MTLRLTLICHASTAALREGRFAGDEPLDDIGRRDATARAAQIPRPDRAWMSASRAARETARYLGVKAEEAPLLRECDLGRWTGRSFEELQVREAEALALWRADASSAPHGGESFNELMGRADQWLRSRDGAEGREVVIGDPLILRALIACAIEGPPSMLWHLDLVPLALVRLNRTAGRWHLRFDREA